MAGKSSGVLVIIPTYDERDNVVPIAAAIHRVRPETEILFVDDNSPDGTGAVLDGLAASDGRIHVMHRAKKNGLGRAYVAGFKWALEREYAYVFEMDADFSHDPAEIPNFLAAARDSDLVIGSRYVEGIRITNWPLGRLMLSKTASLYARAVTGMPVMDPTGGFKCYRREVLEAVPLDNIISSGYAFQVEMTYMAWMRGFRIREIPITFVDRRSGYSKMSRAIMKEALLIVWKIAIRNGFRRRPAARTAGGASRTSP